MQAENDGVDEYDCDDAVSCNDDTIMFLEESESPSSNNNSSSPVLFLYDCETT